ncbi:unnamed protein product [Adineta steineri]|uniref:NAD(P)(+)--arginine ADP-ribosyltransferase n=1 Tax=Adineta steineri TaxID=433720 RepID=A0A814DBN9_9BILA|nr:unnamed protein product [Adineta steineri]CAF1498665.1 unnamed protein product [Adineta steineri]
MAQSNRIPSERFLDATSEPQRRLTPIHGYELKPLVPLEEAVRPLESLITNIQGSVWTAIGNCEQPKDGLTPNESAAIYLYTMECMYRQLNTALRNENRDQLVPYFSYLKLFLTALWKLNDFHDLVYRGVKRNISDDFPKGKKFAWWGLSSTTTSLDVLQADTFLGENGPRTLFNIQCFNGKMIQNHSQFPTENEVLLLPCSYFEVMGNMKQGADLRIIHLKQIEPPVVLIQPPSPSMVHHKVSTSTNKQSDTLEHLQNLAQQNDDHLVCGGRRCEKCHGCRDWKNTTSGTCKYVCRGGIRGFFGADPLHGYNNNIPRCFCNHNKK